MTAKAGVGGDGGESVIEGYLAVINLLACARESWVLVGVDDAGKTGSGGKRKVVTLKDIRKEYQDELDRMSMLENGRFGFGYANGAEDGMDVL